MSPSATFVSAVVSNFVRLDWRLSCKKKLVVRLDMAVKDRLMYNVKTCAIKISSFPLQRDSKNDTIEVNSEPPLAGGTI